MNVMYLCRTAIQDMVVRGAPAIAIAAALALAVELANNVPHGTPADAAQLIADRLEYLVSRCYLPSPKGASPSFHCVCSAHINHHL